MFSTLVIVEYRSPSYKTKYSNYIIEIPRLSNAVIDKDILGWGNDHAEEIVARYSQKLEVGKHSDLPQRSFDSDVAKYCKVNDCVLFTGDQRAYTHFFEAGIKTIQVSQYDWYQPADKPVYLKLQDLCQSDASSECCAEIAVG